MSILSRVSCLRAQRLAPSLARRAPLVRASCLRSEEQDDAARPQQQQWQLRTAAGAAAALLLGGTMAAPPALCASLGQRTAELAEGAGRAFSSAAAEPQVVSVSSLPPLPYKESSLEPHIDTETMSIHYNKHHQTYVTNLGKALEKAPELQGKDLVALQRAVGTSEVPQGVASAIRNSGGGHFNHALWWRTLAPASDKAASYEASASPELKAAIEKKFGSLQKFQDDFSAAATGLFGSGWQWLGVDEGQELVLTSTSNQDNPLMKAIVPKASIPILGLDVWEHAYYLKHQNKRPAYIQDWLQVINWQVVSDNYAHAVQGKVPSTA